jgi:hypothetical protein
VPSKKAFVFQLIGQNCRDRLGGNNGSLTMLAGKFFPHQAGQKDSVNHTDLASNDIGAPGIPFARRAAP